MTPEEFWAKQAEKYQKWMKMSDEEWEQAIPEIEADQQKRNENVIETIATKKTRKDINRDHDEWWNSTVRDGWNS